MLVLIVPLHTARARQRDALFRLAMIGLIIIFSVAGGEALLRLFAPRPYLYPRWEHSREYGHILAPNRRMIAAQPGRWHFTYTTNRYGYRGAAVPLSNSYVKPNIVILGDSYSFGAGVDDGDQYSAIMAASLDDAFTVINLSAPGWGLTQEVRRFYEFGQLYLPIAVLLQFCANDLADNIEVPVTDVKDGRFVFNDTSVPLEWLQIYLGRSWIIQHSQLYILGRQLYTDITTHTTHATAGAGRGDGGTLYAQLIYEELLSTFANDLHRRGVRLFMIAVNGQLDPFKQLQSVISDLDTTGSLRYIEVKPWFDNVTDYGSPEGHWWGKKAHRILGNELAQVMREDVRQVDGVPPELPHE